MSCFVAIPSIGDTKGAKFGRLKFWNLENEWIHVTPDGTASKVVPAATALSGLLIIGLPFLKQQSAAAQALLVKNEVKGIFLHPGRSNTPGTAELESILELLNPDLRNAIRPKVVAFTHSGNRSYQVVNLQKVWSWLAEPPGTGNTIPSFDFASLSVAYEKLRRMGSRNLLVEVCILAQGCVEGQLTEDARKAFLEKLSKFFDGEGAWIVNDSEFHAAVAPLRTQLKNAQLSSEIVEQFLNFVRRRFAAHPTSAPCDS